MKALVESCAASLDCGAEQRRWPSGTLLVESSHRLEIRTSDQSERRPAASTQTWELGVPGATALLVTVESHCDHDVVSTCCNVFWDRGCVEAAASLVDAGASQRFVLLAPRVWLKHTCRIVDPDGATAAGEAATRPTYSVRVVPLGPPSPLSRVSEVRTPSPHGEKERGAGGS